MYTKNSYHCHKSNHFNRGSVLRIRNILDICPFSTGDKYICQDLDFISIFRACWSCTWGWLVHLLLLMLSAIHVRFIWIFFIVVSGKNIPNGNIKDIKNCCHITQTANIIVKLEDSSKDTNYSNHWHGKKWAIKMLLCRRHPCMIYQNNNCYPCYIMYKLPYGLGSHKSV